MARESYRDEKLPINHEAGEAHAPFSQFLAMLKPEADRLAVASYSLNASKNSASKRKTWGRILLSQKTCWQQGNENTNDDPCVFGVWCGPSGFPAVTLVPQLSNDE